MPTKTSTKKKSAKRSTKKTKKAEDSFIESPEGSNLQHLIQQESQNVQNDNFDDEYDVDLEENGPDVLQHRLDQRDAKIIDEMLMTVPRSRGFYLKLYRETNPNQWEYKTRIDQYENWSDLEFEIANFVDKMTKKSPLKWGSGTYKIVIWNDHGMRGSGYKPVIFHIDVNEPDSIHNQIQANYPPSVDSQEQLSNQIDNFAKLSAAFAPFVPRPTDPGQSMETAMKAFHQGLEAKTGDASNQTQMITAMMTMMMGVMEKMMNRDAPKQINATDELAKTVGTLRDLGMVGQQNEKKDLFQTLAELKAIGIEPFKPNDSLQEMNKMKSMISLAKDVFGGELGADVGERPSMIEKLVDNIGPHIGTILTAITQAQQNPMMRPPFNVNPQQGMRMPGQTVPNIPIPPLAPPNKQPQARPTPYEENYSQPQEDNFEMGSIGGGHPSAASMMNAQPKLEPDLGHTQPPEPSQPQMSEQEMQNYQFLSIVKRWTQQNNIEAYKQLIGVANEVPILGKNVEEVLNGTKEIDTVRQEILAFAGSSFKTPQEKEQLYVFLVDFFDWCRRELEIQVQAQSAQTPIQEATKVMVSSNGNTKDHEQTIDFTQQQSEKYINDDPELDAILNQPRVESDLEEGEIVVHCPKCKRQYVVMQEQFQLDSDEEKVCDGKLGEGLRCDGILQYIEIEDSELK